MKRSLLIVPVVLVLALAFPVSALAAGPADGRVVFGSDYTLERGETLEGDLLVLGGNVKLEKGSTVEGSVFVIGGNVSVEGKVDGDLGALGGNVQLMRTAEVFGDVSTLGGNIDRQSGATILGEIVPGTAFDFQADVPLDLDQIMRGERIPTRLFSFGWAPVTRVIYFVLRTLLLAALAILVVMFWTEPAMRVAQAALAQPWATGGIGLLTLVVTPIFLLLLLVTIILSPVSLVGAILLVVAGVFGWIALGLEVGNRIAEAAKWELHEAASAGLGTLLLGLVAGGIGFVPCVGWVAPFLITSVGIGAVLMTRFGSQLYPGTEQLPAPEKAKTPSKKK